MKKYKHVWISYSLAIGLGTAPPLTAAERTPMGVFAVQQQWKIGGPGSWNRLTADPAFHRLYVPRNNRVTVVDTETGKVASEMTGFLNVRSVSLDSSGKYGYITDGERNSVSVFDRATLGLVVSIPAGKGPDAGVFDAFSQSLYVLNPLTKSVTVIDARSNSVYNSIALSGKPANAASDKKGSLFVTLQDKGEIVRIDTRERTSSAPMPLEDCVGPSGLTIDTGRSLIYATCENNRVAALDASTGKTMGTEELGDGARDIAFDPHAKVIFAVNPGGTVTILRPESAGHMTQLQKLETMAGARTLAFDPTTERIYLASAQFGLRSGETSEELLFRPTPVPGSFVVLVLSR